MFQQSLKFSSVVYNLWSHPSLNLAEGIFVFPWVQNLQVKMRGRGFPWTKLLMVLFVFAAGFIAHDIRSHGSFEGASLSPTQHWSWFLVFLWRPNLCFFFCFFFNSDLRFHHSQASSQLRCLRSISAGLEQNNSLHQTRLQVWPPTDMLIRITIKISLKYRRLN